MATQYFYSSIAGAGSRADLTSGNGVYVSENVTIGSEDAYCLTGTGSQLSFDIDGTVYGDLGGLSLTSTTSGTSVRIGEDGVVGGSLVDGTAFSLSNVDGSIENRGEIRGDKGFEITGDSEVTISNYGTVRTSDTVLHTDVGATGSVEFVNYGRVEQSGLSTSGDFFKSEGKTVDGVLNLGVMNGQLALGDGNDAYYGGRAKPMDQGIALIFSILGEAPAKIASIVDAGGGDDQLLGSKYMDYFVAGSGNDSVSGGGGDDVLVGGVGEDTLTGGGGADEFVFSAAGDSRGAKIDEIVDFNQKQHDTLAIEFDAKPKTAAIDSFKFIGTHAFSGKPGELRYEFHKGETYLLGNTDNDKQAEFEVHLHGEIHLVGHDFGVAALL